MRSRGTASGSIVQKRLDGDLPLCGHFLVINEFFMQVDEVDETDFFLRLLAKSWPSRRGHRVGSFALRWVRFGVEQPEARRNTKSITLLGILEENSFPGSQVDYKKNGLTRGTEFGNFLYSSRSKYSLWTSRAFVLVRDEHLTNEKDMVDHENILIPHCRWSQHREG